MIAIAGCVAAMASTTAAFEGRITAEIVQGNETTPLLYTVGGNPLRIEVTGTDRPNPIDIVDLKSGAWILLFPHNRSFVRLKPKSETAPIPPRGVPDIPMPPGGMPPGIGPQSATHPGVPTKPPMQAAPGAGRPPMPMMRPGMNEKIELKATGKKETILGFACEQFEIKSRSEMMEIWATDKLFPFQPYVRNQAPRFGPRMIEEEWPELLTAKKLFPMRASLRFDEGAEHFRFEVKSITPGKIKDEKQFQPPTDYTEIPPLPF